MAEVQRRIHEQAPGLIHEQMRVFTSMEGYRHLQDNPDALAQEWFARQAENSPHLLQKPGLLRAMWELFKGVIQRLGLEPHTKPGSELDAQLQELLQEARDAALRRPATAQGSNLVHGSYGPRQRFSHSDGASNSSPSPADNEAKAAAINLANQAWDSILKPTHYDNTEIQADHGSTEATRAALVAAESLCRDHGRSNQGWDRMAARQYQAQRQRLILQQAVGTIKWNPPSDLIGHRGEHSVYRDVSGLKVLKQTHGGRHGYVVDQGADVTLRRLTLRDAMPSEYLLRIGLMNAVFGDRIRLAAILHDPYRSDVPAMVIEQPFLEGTHDADETAIRSFMEEAGFRALDIRLFDQNMLPDGLWYRDSDHLLVADANPSNFVRLINSEQLVPIDLVITQYPPELLAEVEKRNGVTPPNTGSSSEMK